MDLMVDKTTAPKGAAKKTPRKAATRPAGPPADDKPKATKAAEPKAKAARAILPLPFVCSSSEC